VPDHPTQFATIESGASLALSTGTEGPTDKSSGQTYLRLSPLFGHF
jgi:hypothetical protein